MAAPTYLVEILDSGLQPITQLKAFVPLDNTGNILEYTNRLSNVGTCKFRIATLDPALQKFGDILKPWSNHIRIKRNGQVAWQGLVGNAPQRNRRFIEVRGKTYLSEFNKVLVRHDPPKSDGTDTRTFDKGTIADVLNIILQEGRSDAWGRKINGMVIGALENPVFPPGFTDINKRDVSGRPWTFDPTFFLTFDFKDLLYVVNALSIYAKYDYELTNDLVFNFRKRIGVDHLDLVFEFAQYGMIEDFNAPLDGDNQVNDITGLAADVDTKLLKTSLRDEPSNSLYGRLMGVAAFSDAKNANVLLTRLSEQLRLDSTPDSEVQAQLNERAYPLGQYGLGDTVTMRIKFGGINVDGPRQIVGISTLLHNVGKETITLITNKPRTYA